VEATRLIKAIESTRETRVIAYTATAPADELFLNTMFSAVIQKPAPPDVVLAAVRHLAEA
jgi:CheY-like chemotaxis protein